MHLLGGPQLGQLGVGDEGVDRLGDGHEPGLAVQDDERDAPPLGGPDQRRWQGPGETAAELDHEAGSTSGIEVGHIGGQAGVVIGEVDAGREEQLAASEHAGDVGQLGHVRPTHRAVEMVGSGDDLGAPSADCVEGQDVGQRRRGRHADSLSRTVAQA